MKVNTVKQALAVRHAIMREAGGSPFPLGHNTSATFSLRSQWVPACRRQAALFAGFAVALRARESTVRGSECRVAVRNPLAPKSKKARSVSESGLSFCLTLACPDAAKSGRRVDFIG